MTIRTAIVVWSDDSHGDGYDMQELGSALARCEDPDADNTAFFVLIEPGVTPAALAAGADPTSWDDGYAPCALCGTWRVCTDLDDAMVCERLKPGERCSSGATPSEVVVTIGPEFEGVRAVAYGPRPFPFKPVE